MTEFRLVILSPDRAHYAGTAVSVTAPGQAGEFGVLARHIPLVAGLQAGAVQVRESGGKTLHFAVDGGVLGVDPGAGVRILTGRAAACPDPAAAHKAAAEFGRKTPAG